MRKSLIALRNGLMSTSAFILFQHFSDMNDVSMQYFLIAMFSIFFYMLVFSWHRFSREKKNGVKYPEIRMLIGTGAPCIGFFICICWGWYPDVWNCPSCKQVYLYEDNSDPNDYSYSVSSQWCRKCKRDEPHPKLYTSDKPFYSH